MNDINTLERLRQFFTGVKNLVNGSSEHAKILLVTDEMLTQISGIKKLL